MSNTIYENFVLESKLTDLLNTKLNVKSLMTIDTDLAESAGMIKKINTYTYTGEVEEVAAGEGNETTGAVSYTQSEHEVVVSQQKFEYTDEDFMQDPKVVDMGLEGASTLMVNDMNSKFFEALQDATLEQAYTAFTDEAPVFDTVVDAIAQMNLEDESGLFLIISPSMKATIRKDSEFKAKELGQIIANGAIGAISGVPVVVSQKVPSGVMYIATKEAVTLFTKKESEIEQERDADTRTNGVYMRKVNLIALTDATKAVAILPYITAPVITTESLTAGEDVALAGTCVPGATISIYVDGVDSGDDATVDGTSWTYTIETATAAEVYTVVASKANYADKVSADSLTVAEA